MDGACAYGLFSSAQLAYLFAYSGSNLCVFSEYFKKFLHFISLLPTPVLLLDQMLTSI
jgi:hypothetical protein